MVCRHRPLAGPSRHPTSDDGSLFSRCLFLDPETRGEFSLEKKPNRLGASNATSRQAGASSPGTMSDDDDLKKDAEPDFETLERDFQQVRPREDAARMLFPPRSRIGICVPPPGSGPRIQI